MVTATKPRGRKTKEEEAALIDVPVEFGGVSIGEATARLGVRISRSCLTLAKADQCFCGHRLTGCVQLGGSDDASGQLKLADDLEHAVKATFDCKRLGVSADTLSIGLTFSLKDINVADLAKFSKGAGRLVVEDVSEIPESNSHSTKGSDEENEDDEDE